MSIPILVVEMPQIIPFPVYDQTGNGIIMFWNWFWGHFDLWINFCFHVHTRFVSHSWDMIYSFITLNIILFMAKFIMKTTTNLTTDIMLSLSLHPVITTKKTESRFELSLRSYCTWKRGDKSVTHRQTHRQTHTHTDIGVYRKGTATQRALQKWDRSRSVGHAIIQSTKKLDHWDLRINFGFHVYTHFGNQNASNNSISCLQPNRKWNYDILKLVLWSFGTKDQLLFSCPCQF